jgi:hypothetical protein
MSEQRRRAMDGRPWYRDPGWLTLFLGLLLHTVAAAYLYGRIAEKVDSVEQQQRIILEYILNRAPVAGGR